MSEDSTVRRLRNSESGPRPVWHRRVGVGALTLIVIAAATGMLGVHSRHVSATADGYTLTVTYAGVARPGLDVPLRIELMAAEPFADGPLNDEIVLAITGSYFDIFETQGFHPEPSATTGDGTTLSLTFDPPPAGSTFAVDYDAYIQPASQRGASAVISLLIDDQPVVSTSFSTFLFP